MISFNKAFLFSLVQAIEEYFLAEYHKFASLAYSYQQFLHDFTPC